MALEPNEQLDLLDSINVTPFKAKHFNMLIEMLKDQNYPDIESITMKTLPKIGYIAMLQDQPIAAGFLRRVEGNVVAQIDGLTSNPYFGSIIRHNGISRVVDMLILDAKQLKLKGIIAFCIDASTIKRAEDIGFQRVEHQIISLRL